MFERAALIHYNEIGLKGRNRPRFEQRLLDNLAAQVGGLTTPLPNASRADCSCARPTPRDSTSSARSSRCSQAWATQHLSHHLARQHDLNAAGLLAVREALGEYVRCRRAAIEHDHPVSSMDMNIAIGQHIVDETGLEVNLDHPGATAWVEVVGGEAYVFGREFPGVGGLPVGSAGKVMALLSSGIDSPVAAWKMAKRGAVVVGVHFSGRPHTSDSSEHLVDDIAHALERFGGIGRVYFVPFGELQKEISLNAPPDLRVLLYRRLMIKVTEAIAAFENGKALVTGESLGQVASQTLENIAGCR